MQYSTHNVRCQSFCQTQLATALLKVDFNTTNHTGYEIIDKCSKRTRNPTKNSTDNNADDIANNTKSGNHAKNLRTLTTTGP